jgi:hypothetical protein
MLRSTFVSNSRIEQTIDRAVDYVVSRQCRNGGFCYYRSDDFDLEEPNLRDTYYAVAACKLLTREIPNRDRVVDYLRSMRTAGRQSSYLYYYAFTAQRLGEPELLDQVFLDRVAELRINLPQADKNVPLSDWLEDSLWIIRLKKTFTNHSAMDEVKNFVRDLFRSGGVGVKPNLVDTYLALSVLAELNGLAGLDKAKAFVNRLQLPSFGFGYTEDSLSSPSIDIVYAGVFSCALLGLRVRYPADIVNSILMSQRVHGGFTRSPDSLGDLDTHFRALSILQQL